MIISEQEHRAIKQVVALGEEFGYGNLIAHLQTAWARVLMAKYDMPEKAARLAARGGEYGYRFEMQRDLLERGEWDETGASYRRKGRKP